MIKDKLNLLEDKPGCYLMYDKDGNIIYIGKAKNLKKRVSQYFLKEHKGKTKLMVSNVQSFDTIITHSEKEALLLENNLIKKHNPKYNILLKDDKRYPYVKLIIDEYPYLEIARNIKDKKAIYYGPFSDSSAAYNSINLLNQIYPLRKCKNIPSKECLYAHLGMCLAPCTNKINKEDVDEIIRNVDEFYNGNAIKVKKKLTEKMYQYSENLDFENAKECKELIAYLDHILVKQEVELKNNLNCDFIGFSFKGDYVSMVVLIYRNGILVHKDKRIFETLLDNENYESIIIEYYSHHLKPKKIIVPEYINAGLLTEVFNVGVEHTYRGSKKQILEMAAENARKAMEEYFYKDYNNHQLLIQLKNKLNLEVLPVKIDLFDNSHLQGEAAVGVKVCFENGIANKKLYRKYLINGDNKKDDLASMREVLYRRLFKIISDNDYTPDLIILDGGVSQINVAKEEAEKLHLNINFCGLVKDDKHNTSGLIDQDGNIIALEKQSELFYFLIRMQDEVHRFAITSHKNKRNKSLTTSILDSIEGLGKKRREILLRTFSTIGEIANATVEELSQYVPYQVALNIVEKLNNHN